jgi:hypothetical protein
MQQRESVCELMTDNKATEPNRHRHHVSAEATMELEGYVHCEQARGNVEADGDVKLQTTESIA